MPKDPKLSGFKIGDVQQRKVRASKKATAEAPAPESSSVGFPAIESRLEGGTVESVAEELRNSYEALEALAAEGDGKQKAAAKKAMVAYERTADLFEYLFATKDSIAQKSQ